MDVAPAGSDHAAVEAGASQSRDLGICGETLPGSHGAAEFVAWYNGHPDHADDVYDLSAERAVIVGNGNVALDVARVLLLGPEELAQTDIADHALEALSQSEIREVVILARRTPRDSAFSVGEFAALRHLPGIDVIVESDDLQPGPNDDVETELKLGVTREFTSCTPNPAHKRIIFHYLTSPNEVVGDHRVEGLRISHPDGGGEVIETRLLLRSHGYRGTQIDGMPFDVAKGVVPNQNGRVLGEDGKPVRGVYVTGWIKRRPRGVIGTNRTCAEETVAQLWEDFDAGTLTREVRDRAALLALLAERGVHPVDWQGWRAIDASERRRGADTARPRVKFVDIREMLAAPQADTANASARQQIAR
jgi:ferredoxin--NADP+ reductase